MKTYLEIIKDISNLRWSIVDPDPTSFAEVQKCIKLAVAQANTFIWSLDDFPFRLKKETLVVRKGKSIVAAPKGEIKNVRWSGSDKMLKSISAEKADMLPDVAASKPTTYWVECSKAQMDLHLYPTPATDGFLLVRYRSDLKACAQDGTEKYNLTDMDDYLNLPDDTVFEELYLNCLYTKTMEYLIADTTDENYLPYQKEFKEAYGSLLRYAGRSVQTYLSV